MDGPAKPRFSKNSRDRVFVQLRRDVNKLVQDSISRRRSVIVFKAVLFPILYLAIYLSALTWGSRRLILYGCYFFLGALLVIIFLNIVHDANNKRYNQ